jgi:hypothetical protein
MNVALLVFCICVSLVAFLVGCVVVLANGIQGLLLFLISAVFFAGAFVGTTVMDLKDFIEKEAKKGKEENV